MARDDHPQGVSDEMRDKLGGCEKGLGLIARRMFLTGR